MKKIFFMIIFSLFLLTCLNLFPLSNSLIAQPQMAQPRSTASLTQELLETYTLPAGPITEDDIPQIKTVIEQVLNKISESIKAAGQAEYKADVRPVMSGILIFQDWLTMQGCVKQTSNWYVKAIDEYDDEIFIPCPGEVPVDILFNMEEGIETEDSLYRLLIFVNTVDLLRFASFNKNKTIIVWQGYSAPYLVPSDQ